MHVRRCRSPAALSVLLARLREASPLRREEMRKAYIKSSHCRAIDSTVATKLASQRAFSPGGEPRFAWYPQTYAVPSELPALRRAGAAEPGARWILKDPTLNQGKGVRMLRSLACHDDLGLPIAGLYEIRRAPSIEAFLDENSAKMLDAALAATT